MNRSECELTFAASLIRLHMLVRASDRHTQLVLLRSRSESSEDIAVGIQINQH